MMTTLAPNPGLVSIIAHARSGALERAEQLFAEAGFDRVQDNPAVLSVRGRLLKDHALLARGAERKRLYLKAARAYAQAAAIAGTTYPLINAATLSLLAGHPSQAQTLARRVLALDSADPEEAETPYWRGATKAEARLLLGDLEAARKHLSEAIALAPHAFEDHASTLRQFELIARELKEDRAWLDAFRPPRTLHFAGHITLPFVGTDVESQIREFIVRERIGSGFGALAAGADILIAEGLVNAGAELHLVLPCPLSMFRQMSVAHFGAAWSTRFDEVVQHASTVHILNDGLDAVSPAAIRLAAEVAMGKAVMLAESLMTEAVQLLLLAKGPRRADNLSAAIAQEWHKTGRRQQVIPVRRRTGKRRASRRAEDGGGRLAAMLRVEFNQPSAVARSRTVLPRLAKIFSADREVVVPARWTGEAVTVGFSTALAAAESALAAMAALKKTAAARCSAHCGIVRLGSDPFAGKPFVFGPAAELPSRIAFSTPAGAIHVSEDFAAALCAGQAAGRPRVEFIGELPDDQSGEALKLFSLKR